MNKHNLMVFVFLGLFFLFGCRKEIIHEIGKTPIVESTEDNENTSADWQLVNSNYIKLFTLEVYEGSLYLGGEFENVNNTTFLVKYDGNNFNYAVSGDFLFNGVYKLQTIGSRLWIGGNFSYWDNSNNYANLMYIENNTIGGYKFGSYNTEIRNILSYNNDIILTGEWGSATNINTYNIERIRNNSIIGFDASTTNEIYSSTVHLNQLTVCGKSDLITGSLKTTGIWNGSAWVDVSPGSGSFFDPVHSILNYKNELYSSGTLWNSTKILRKYNGTTWNDVNNITISGSNSTKLIEDNGNLYLIGKGLAIDNILKSNVLKYDGTNWSAVGTIKNFVHDIKTFNGELYCATDLGLYKLKNK